MLNFPKKTIDFIKNNLLKQQKEVEKSLKEVSDEDPAKDDSLAESSEPGTDSYIADSHTRTLALEEQLKKAHTSIKTALFKIGKGNYGKCENCGKQMEIGRLLALPTAQYCLPCSKKHPHKKT